MGVTIHYRGPLTNRSGYGICSGNWLTLRRAWAGNTVCIEVNDEGGFWETGDRAALEAKMHLLNEKMDELAMDLKAESLGEFSGLSAEEIASRIEDFLKERQ